MPTSEYWEMPWPETLRCLPEKTMLKKHGESWIHCSKKPRLSTLTSQTAGDRMRWSESRRREGGRIRLLHTRIQPGLARRREFRGGDAGMKIEVCSADVTTARAAGK